MTELVRIFECEYCGLDFDSRHNIREHKKKCSHKQSFECSFCNELFPSRNILRKHIDTCTERPSYNCYGCAEKLYSKSDLNYHQIRCKSALRKCAWITRSGRRCTFTGKYDGFCKKHFIDYIYYNPNGVKSENGDIDICSMVIKTKYVPTSINNMVNGDFYSLEYCYNKSMFITKEHNISNIVMENTESKENIIFWENKEVRKHKAGKLITQLSADYEYECESDALIIFNDGNRMCKKCFETHYNTTINSIIIRKQD